MLGLPVQFCSPIPCDPVDMTDSGNLPARVYGEKEIGEILKRATELQHKEPTAPAAAGVTLAELEEIALEAGIDPAYLRRAAHEISSGATDDSFWAGVAGEAINLLREERLPGELTEVGFERIVATIQATSREHGQPSLLGRTLTWRAEAPNKTRTMQLVVTSRDGYTDIRLEENLGQMAAGVFGGTVAGGGLGLGLGLGLPIGLNLGSTLLATAGPIGIVALTYIGSREIYRHIVKRRRKALNNLFDRTVEEARASISSGTLQGANRPGALPPGS